MLRNVSWKIQLLRRTNFGETRNALYRRLSAFATGIARKAKQAPTGRNLSASRLIIMVLLFQYLFILFQYILIFLFIYLFILYLYSYSITICKQNLTKYNSIKQQQLNNQVIHGLQLSENLKTRANNKVFWR